MSDMPCGVDGREAVIFILVVVDGAMLINPGGQLDVSVDALLDLGYCLSNTLPTCDLFS